VNARGERLRHQAVTGQHRSLDMAVQFVDNPYDGQTLTEQLEQVAILTEDIGVPRKAVMVDLGFRGVDVANPGVQIIHRGKFKSLADRQRRWLSVGRRWSPRLGMSSTTTPWIGAGSGGANRRCAACRAVRSRLQHPLAAARDRAPEAQGSFMRLFARLAQLIQTLVMIHRETITGPEQQLCADV
jgi:hypothetical protein